MPAPQLHLSFGNTVHKNLAVPAAMRAACEAEPTYTRLGAVFHDLPYYGEYFGSMIGEAIRYGLKVMPVDAPWSNRMHSIRPAEFVASYIRAAAQATALTRDEQLALIGGLLSHCALDLSMHPLVNYVARRDAAERGGLEAVHHRLTEKYQALFLHVEQLGEDPLGTPEFRRWTQLVKTGSAWRARAEKPIVDFMDDAYRGAYDSAPTSAQWTGWVRSFRHFGLIVGGRLAARNSKKVRTDANRVRYFENDTFDTRAFYAAALPRLGELAHVGYDYFCARDFSPAAVRAFVTAARIDDLAYPIPQARDHLPALPTTPTIWHDVPAREVTNTATAA